MSAHRYVIITSINCTIAVTSIGSGAAQVTDYLNPSPNLLQFPSRLEEVKLQTNQRITLQQVLELAQRNNPELQRVLFQVERSRAAFREVQAGMYPTINLSTDLNRAQSAFGQLYTEQLGEQAQFLSNQRLNPDEPTTTFSSTGLTQLAQAIAKI
jgi:outer membrane protein TolC